MTLSRGLGHKRRSHHQIEHLVEASSAVLVIGVRLGSRRSNDLARDLIE